MRTALRIEWLKLRSARGTWVLLVLAVLAAGLAAAGASSAKSVQELASADGQRQVAHTAVSGAIFVLVLGILSLTNEFRYGTIVLTTLADPRRVKSLVGKGVSAMLAGVVLGAASVATNIAVASAVLSSRGDSYHISDRQIWSTFVGSISCTVLFGVLGVAIGAFVRRGPAAIIGSLAWLLVLEQLVGQVWKTGRPYLPGAAEQALARVPDTWLLTMWQGALVSAGYLVVAVVLALGVTRHRDV